MKTKHVFNTIRTTHVLLLSTTASSRGSFAPHMPHTFPALDDGSSREEHIHRSGSRFSQRGEHPLLPMTDLRNTKFQIEVALALGMEAFV
jgi:hypothetical protein